MKKIISAKVGRFSAGDAVLISLAKVVEERVSAAVPFVGNATIKSGLIKIGSAVAMPHITGFTGVSKENKIVSIIATGTMVDGCEDLATVALNYVLGQLGDTQTQVVI